MRPMVRISPALFALGLTLLSATCAFSGPPLHQAPEGVQRPTELPIEQIKKTVVFIRGTYQEGGVAKRNDGTGFFIFVSEPRLGKDGAVVFLVTAKHVLREPRPDGTLGPYLKEVLVRCNLKEAVATDGQQFEEATVKVLDDAGNLNWFTDPEDDTVDVALTHVSVDQARIDARWIGTDLFATKEIIRKERVDENDEVLFAGLFAWYPGAKKNYPIVRHGKLSLLPEERIPTDQRHPDVTEDLILAEITSFGGNSGSPVFLRLGGIRETNKGPLVGGYQYYLLGVMKGFFPEAQPFVAEVKEIKGAARQNSGIAAVVPAEKILRILETPRAKAHVEELVRRNSKAKIQ